MLELRTSLSKLNAIVKSEVMREDGVDHLWLSNLTRVQSLPTKSSSRTKSSLMISALQFQLTKMLKNALPRVRLSPESGPISCLSNNSISPKKVTLK